MARTRGNKELRDTELARILFAEVKSTSLRDVAAQIGIGKSTLDNLLYSAMEFPELETIEKIAQYLQMPSYEVLRLAGFDVQLPPDLDQGARLMQIAASRPELRRVLSRLSKLNEEQTRGLLVYLETLETLERLQREAE